MRKSLLLGAALIGLLLPGSMAAGATAPEKANGYIFAGGGTFVSNGAFFPGTAVFDGTKLVGAPYQIPQGSDITFVNLDNGDIANGHQIRSYKQRRGRPLFTSGKLTQPGEQTTMITSHLKPGIYEYGCPIHFGMYGLLEVTP